MNDNIDAKKIVSLYILLTLASVLLCIPITLLASIGALLWTLALILSWALRSQALENKPLYQHMRYITCTIWNGVFIAGITGAVAAVYIAVYADFSIYQAVINDMANGVSFSDATITDAFYQFIGTNLGIIIVAGILYFALPTAYTLYRIYNGIHHARKGIPLPERKWL